MKYRILALTVLATALAAACGSGIAHRTSLWTCTTSAQRGSCGPYQVISGYLGARVLQNDWRPATGDYTVLSASNASNWQSVIQKGGGLGYPDAQQPVPDIASTKFSSIVSTYSESMNANTGTIAEAAYDLWLVDPSHPATVRPGNNGYWELMVWEDNHGMHPAALKYRVGEVTIAGVQYWVWIKAASQVFGITNGYIALTRATNASSGSMNLNAIMSYMRSKRYYPTDVQYSGWDFGWEIANTGGRLETFSMKSLTWAVSLSGTRAR